ncbi:Serine/threonine-protein kinase ppk15 [Sesamum alatum]|uniref:Serine/threonine-protein kinase ppk15 n=1 Tax=Sesamum alatum TaxID=300844 RepID=A0AAE1YUV7_9LAMI|nr:Serine/threonine-protein kinase ppk15 [Sesamum alatum]
MAHLELEAVLEFLRKNGLSESESALIEDVMDKSQMASSELERFFFPMAPPPPPLRIPSAQRLLTPPRGELSDDAQTSKSSSDDEFVSLGSSTTELCSSEFTNPYGIRTTRPTSQASSDRLSQFGTARDYPDFDMQTDLFWYKEKDEDYAMPPLFGGRDFDGDPSEDKYVMTVQTEERIDDQVAYNFIPDGSSKSIESRWDFTWRDNLKDEAYKDYYELGEHFPLEESGEKRDGHCTNYSCSAPLCACCNGAGTVYAHDPKEHKLGNLKVTDENGNRTRTLRERFAENDASFANERSSTYDLVGGFGNNLDVSTRVNKDRQLNENDDFDFIYDEVIASEKREPKVAANEENGATSDELLLYETKEDDYEIFNLRIIHRKNRTGFEENRDFPVVMNSIIAGRYYVTEFLGSAAFSKVVQAHDLYSGMDVCLKIIKNDKDFFDQSLDEIKLLKFVNKHDPADERHILRLYDYFYHQEHLFIVTELLRANLYEFQKYNRESGGEPYFTMHRLQVITRQCLEAVSYLHDLGIIHCDLKPENILIKRYRTCEIKVIDLGSSCFQADNLSLYVQSRSYRAPEVMLGLPYDQKIDLWSVGCILAELCSGEVLFPNEPVVMLLARMIGMLGQMDMDMLKKGQETHKYFTKDYDLYYIDEDTNQTEYIVPKQTSLEHHLQILDSCFIDFLKRLLEINPKRRPTAIEALQHRWLLHSYEVNSF